MAYTQYKKFERKSNNILSMSDQVVINGFTIDTRKISIECMLYSIFFCIGEDAVAYIECDDITSMY